MMTNSTQHAPLVSPLDMGARPASRSEQISLADRLDAADFGIEELRRDVHELRGNIRRLEWQLVVTALLIALGAVVRL